MRAKLLVGVILAGLAVMIAVVAGKRSEPEAPSENTPPSAEGAGGTYSPRLARVNPETSLSQPAPVTLTPAEREAVIRAELERLQQWSMMSDGQAFSNILAALESPEREVRMAAIVAVEQYGGTNAIPTLQRLATGNADVEEKAALEEAARFLSLPNLFDRRRAVPK
jgi:hypothetical protein